MPGGRDVLREGARSENLAGRDVPGRAREPARSCQSWFSILFFWANAGKAELNRCGSPRLQV